ncbi:5-(carboxyamino)imidazole ribonucleotide synthase [Paracoccaceae bacterium GXU_MW_L88]
MSDIKTIGILGGGQLGRMLAVAAARLGKHVVIFAPEDHPPAAEVAAEHIQAAFEDADALARFAERCDVITLEWENIPLEVYDHLGDTPCFPDAKALEITQDRMLEKNFLTRLALPVAPFYGVNDEDDLLTGLANTRTPAILKTRRFGYDGKGQVRVNAGAEAAEAVAAIEGAPAILEGFVNFSAEISVIAARSRSGEIACFDPGQNDHEDGILRVTNVPATQPAGTLQDAVLMAGKILNALDYVGVMGVELFVTEHGLVVNEMAPRVHNSGHWTQNGCEIDQFEQHIRAICDLPLGSGQRHSDVKMVNLIGEGGIPEQPEGALHLYGKAEARPGRKMGHINYARPKAQ